MTLRSTNFISSTRSIEESKVAAVVAVIAAVLVGLLIMMAYAKAFEQSLKDEVVLFFF